MFNRGCGGELNSTFSSDGSVLIVTIATNLASPPTVSFSAAVTSASSATLTAWSSDNFQTARLTAGVVQLNDEGGELVVFPNDPPFQIQSCNFTQYVGAYVPPRSAAAVAHDAAAAFARLTTRAAAPVPELAEP
jgi:hypothetical protein